MSAERVILLARPQRRRGGLQDAFGPRRGFTLLEVLAALGVLLLGLSFVIGLFYGALRNAGQSAERNAAAILIPEAIRQIEWEHLITKEFVDKYPAFADQEGCFIETLGKADVKISDPAFDLAGQVGGSGDPPKAPPDGLDTRPDAKSTPANQMTNFGVWPHFGDNPRKIGRTDKDPVENKFYGGAYRVIYRLEKHPLWWEHDTDGNYAAEDPNSHYRGLYQLTLACFMTGTEKVEDWIQISDPVTVILRDRVRRP